MAERGPERRDDIDDKLPEALRDLSRRAKLPFTAATTDDLLWQIGDSPIEEDEGDLTDAEAVEILEEAAGAERSGEKS